MFRLSKEDHAFISAFCERWAVREMSLFGSTGTERFSPSSDLDFLVDFIPGVMRDLFEIIEMKQELEDHFGRPVGLVQLAGVRNPWRRQSILKSQRVLYAHP